MEPYEAQTKFEANSMLVRWLFALKTNELRIMSELAPN